MRHKPILRRVVVIAVSIAIILLMLGLLTFASSPDNIGFEWSSINPLEALIGLAFTLQFLLGLSYTMTLIITSLIVIGFYGLVRWLVGKVIK